LRRITLVKTINSSNADTPLYPKTNTGQFKKTRTVEVEDPCDGEPLTSTIQGNSVKKTKTTQRE